MSSQHSPPKPAAAADEAVHNFVEDSFNCAEAIVAALSRAEGLEPRALTSLATAFGGGIGSLGHLCGALSGGLMMLGRRAAAQGVPKPEIRARAQELYRRFEETFGTVDCRTLTQHDCNAAGGAPYDIRNCAKYIRLATDGALELSAAAPAAKVGWTPDRLHAAARGRLDALGAGGPVGTASDERLRGAAPEPAHLLAAADSDSRWRGCQLALARVAVTS